MSVALREREQPRTNKVGFVDSVEKLVHELALVSPLRVAYRNERGRSTVFAEQVDAVVVAPSFYRRFTCTAGCTACCQKFTLDYIPAELDHVPNLDGFAPRPVWVNSIRRTVWTNDQSQNPLCDFLTAIRPEGGLGCGQWPLAPLSCASAPQIQFIQARPGVTYVMKKPFGRAWAMKPLPQCDFRPDEDLSFLDGDLDLLWRFHVWAVHLGIPTALLDIIHRIESVRAEGIVSTGTEAVWQRT